MKALTAAFAVLATLTFASVASAEGGCSGKDQRASTPPPTVGS
jgi:hypothetical protein